MTVDSVGNGLRAVPLAGRHIGRPLRGVKGSLLPPLPSQSPAKFPLIFTNPFAIIPTTLQGSYIGNTTASQAVKAGSIPVPCSRKNALCPLDKGRFFSDAFLAERDAHCVRDADDLCDARLRRVGGTHRITSHSVAASLLTGQTSNVRQRRAKPLPPRGEAVSGGSKLPPYDAPSKDGVGNGLCAVPLAGRHIGRPLRGVKGSLGGSKLWGTPQSATLTAPLKGSQRREQAPALRCVRGVSVGKYR